MAANLHIQGPARIAVVVGLFVAILLGALDQFVVLTALPTFALQLGASAQVPFVISTYLVTATVGIPIFGRLADLYSRRNVVLLGLATFLGGSALAGISQTMTQLILFRAIQGFSSGAFIVVGFAISAVLFPPEVRARLAGLFSGSFVVATIFGPLLGSFLVDHVGWRWVFFVNLPVGAAAAGLLALRLGRLTPERAEGFDGIGATLLTGWVGTLMFAAFQASTGGWSWTDVRVVALLASAIALFAAFVLWERHSPQPLVPLRQFSNRVFSASGTIAFFRGAVLSAVLAFVAVFVGLVLLRGQPNAADTVRDLLYWLLVPGVIGAGLGSQLAVRLPYRPLALLGVGLATLGTVLLTLTAATGSIWVFAFGFLPIGGLVVTLPLIGLGVGLTIPLTLLSAQFTVRDDEVGSATATIQFLGALGGALAISVLTSFQLWRFTATSPAPLAACTGPATAVPSCTPYFADVHQALLSSFQQTFAAIAVLMAVALIASLFLTGSAPRGRTPDPGSAGRGPDQVGGG